VGEVDTRWSITEGDVEQDDVRVEGVDRPPTGFDIGRCLDDESGAGERTLEQRGHEWLVLDDEKVSTASWHGPNVERCGCDVIE
jgi:hypothetical protein